MTPTQPDALSPITSPVLLALQRLVEVVAELRHPESGCPWDLAQTPQTLIPYVIEEAYEVVEAIQVGNADDIAEELGDLLLQVVLQAQIAQDKSQFDLAVVANGIADKLVRRHPHVFGDVSVANVQEVNRNWERIKAEEKGLPYEPHQLTPKLQKYSRTLPPLMAAMKISQKAAAAGFEWENVEGVWDKFWEELAEFQQAIASEPKANQQAELGDLLFTIVNLARWYDLDPTAALQGTHRRFIERFTQVEAVAERSLKDYSPAELESLWQQAKAKLSGNLS
ncbi:MAG: nucleoside triphosphate pyrophosphohydrolase [Leptolyngbyaceae cyanobacterium SM1_1_3]|nr:nucleoside triphosphate pyrophosphohydrolase [Leptolyngbyaceae cyanobacterium SM1_1_3]NJN02317.1 nucleoside triphosphate pyrophosphohydrolase [Leptolyngbyaceae cyanobacterium RM1_1_2]NJO10626.1 nucleoside triphosphate pyrophosphohydrolase [Leptolyngbyaceae cyanobacterium SL_1_1]